MSITLRRSQGIADPNGRVAVLDAPAVFSPDAATSPANPNVPQGSTPDELFGITVLPMLDTEWNVSDITNGVLQSGNAIGHNLGEVIHTLVQLDKQYSILRRLASSTLLAEQTRDSAAGSFPDPLADTPPVSKRLLQLSGGTLDNIPVSEYGNDRLFRAIRVWNFLLDRISMLLADDTTDVDDFVAAGYETQGQLYSRLRTLYSVRSPSNNAPYTVEAGEVQNAIALLDISTGGVPLYTGDVVPVYTPAVWTSVLSRVRAVRLLDAYGHMYALATRTSVGLVSEQFGLEPFVLTEPDAPSQIAVALQGDLAPALTVMTNALPTFGVASEVADLAQAREEMSAALLLAEIEQDNTAVSRAVSQAVSATDTSIVQRAEENVLASVSSPPTKTASPIKSPTPQPTSPVRLSDNGAVVVQTPRKSPLGGPSESPPRGSTTPVAVTLSPEPGKLIGKISGEPDVTVSVVDVPTVAEFMSAEQLVPATTPVVLGQGSSTSLAVYDVLLTRNPHWLAEAIEAFSKDLESQVQRVFLETEGIPPIDDKDENTYGNAIVDVFTMPSGAREAAAALVSGRLNEQILLQAQMRPARQGGRYLGPSLVLSQARTGAFDTSSVLATLEEETPLPSVAYQNGFVDNRDRTQTISFPCEAGVDLTGFLRFYSSNTDTDDDVLVPEDVRAAGSDTSPAVLTFRAGVQYWVDFSALLGVATTRPLRDIVPHPDTPSKALRVNDQLRALMREGYESGTQVGAHAGNTIALCLFGMGGADEVQTLSGPQTSRGSTGPDGTGPSDAARSRGRGYTDDVDLSLVNAMNTMRVVLKDEGRTKAALAWWGDKGSIIDQFFPQSPGSLAKRLVLRLATFTTLVQYHSGSKTWEDVVPFPEPTLRPMSGGTPLAFGGPTRDNETQEQKQTKEQKKTKELIQGIVAQAVLPDDGTTDDVRGGLVMMYAMLRASTVAFEPGSSDTVLDRRITESTTMDGVTELGVRLLQTAGRGLRAAYPLPSAFMPEENLHLADRVRVVGQAVSTMLKAYSRLFLAKVKDGAKKPKVAEDQLLSDYGIFVESRDEGKELSKIINAAMARVRPKKQTSKKFAILLPFRFAAFTDGAEFDWPLTQSMILALAQPLAVTTPTEDGVLGIDSLLRDWRLLSGKRTDTFGKFSGAAVFHTPKSELRKPMVEDAADADYAAASLGRWGVSDQASVWSLAARERMDGLKYFVETRLETTAARLTENLQHYKMKTTGTAMSENKDVAVSRLNAFYQRSIVSPAATLLQGETSEPKPKPKPRRSLVERALDAVTGRT